jgi:hypothetical protein
MDITATKIHHQAMEDELSRAAETEDVPQRFGKLPPRIRLADTVAEQETPPKPEAIANPPVDAQHEFMMRHA